LEMLRTSSAFMASLPHNGGKGRYCTLLAPESSCHGLTAQHGRKLDGPGRDCPGVDGTMVLSTIVLCRFCICTASLGDTTRVALSRTFVPECPGRRRLSKWPGECGRWVRSLRRGERERRLRSWLQTSVIAPTRMEPAFRPVLSQSVDTATARATARGPGNSLLILFLLCRIGCHVAIIY
jgi:hypothetical protein